MENLGWLLRDPPCRLELGLGKKWVFWAKNLKQKPHSLDQVIAAGSKQEIVYISMWQFRIHYCIPDSKLKHLVNLLMQTWLEEKGGNHLWFQ